jgi:hypothetical protein
MSENVKSPAEGKYSKKRIRTEVYARLSEALSSFKNGSPEKQFSQSLKKASKLLAKDFAKSEKKMVAKNSKPKKKTAAKKSSEQQH